ncbi:hypothetical protein BCR44DRAFT_1137563 [Catenaria anguillulae PL171]|uniref:Uncharacterized protein n=1 Tax=Catenaria anguillulae PL171 TaxID=765915 RepID=A0A1Y2HK27_9FUNG|nr:hypothetical protein BCR44DRAFT_1137563 [Catenaria anguillulae PL171]
MELEGVVPVIAKAAQTKLMSIEQDFNGIRDELFEKRWEFLEVEEEQIRNGTHPAYIENMKAAQAAHDERVARATALYQYQTNRLKHTLITPSTRAKRHLRICAGD